VVPAALSRTSPTDGLQPLRLARDWRQVLDLIELAFGQDLDVEAQRALRSMRLPLLLTPLVSALDRMAPPGESMMPGFVWLEGGHVVGTTSVRRLSAMNSGWLVSNVAVHPDWQGRGIGRALLEASLDFAQDHGGTWVVLQVRDSNSSARNLYESLGFQPIGQVRRLRRPSADVLPAAAVAHGLRPARWYHGSALTRLARMMTPHDILWADTLNRNLYATGPLSHLANHLHGLRRSWWVSEKPNGGPEGLRAAVGIEIDRQTPWHRLRLLVTPKAQDEVLAEKLVTFGLSQLTGAPPKPIEIEHPASDQTVQAALTEAGFAQKYALVHLRLDLSLEQQRQRKEPG
jgi:GNAT superfamily N-acetyltransferase